MERVEDQTRITGPGLGLIFKEEMENAADGWVDWKLPIVVEPNFGENWGVAH